VVVGASVVVVDVVVAAVVVGADSGSTAAVVVVVGMTVVVVDVVGADVVVVVGAGPGSTVVVVVVAVVVEASVVAAATVVVTNGSGAGPAACASADSWVSAETGGTGCCGATAAGAEHPTRTVATAKKLSPRAARTRVFPSCLAIKG